MSFAFLSSSFALYKYLQKCEIFIVIAYMLFSLLVAFNHFY
jgi:hypothetical protein